MCCGLWNVVCAGARALHFCAPAGDVFGAVFSRATFTASAGFATRAAKPDRARCIPFLPRQDLARVLELLLAGPDRAQFNLAGRNKGYGLPNAVHCFPLDPPLEIVKP